MAIILICKRCKGKGKIKTKIPFIKLKCHVCKGTGRLNDLKK